jgi:hypothetical protein
LSHQDKDVNKVRYNAEYLQQVIQALLGSVSWRRSTRIGLAREYPYRGNDSPNVKVGHRSLAILWRGSIGLNAAVIASSSGSRIRFTARVHHVLHSLLCIETQEVAPEFEKTLQIVIRGSSVRLACGSSLRSRENGVPFRWIPSSNANI